MARLTLQDDLKSTMIKMSDGVPGALRVMMELIEQTPNVDPECAMGGIMKILMLDDLEIYGSRIWMLYKDVCNSHVDVMIALMRAYQLGYVTEKQLNAAIDGRGAGIDLIDVIGKAQKEIDTLVVTTDPKEFSYA